MSDEPGLPRFLLPLTPIDDEPDPPPGAGWPVPDTPGVPLAPLFNGFHWMRFSTGAFTVGQWAPDIWGWVISYQGMCGPEALAHLDYIGRAEPPATPGQRD